MFGTLRKILYGEEKGELVVVDNLSRRGGGLKIGVYQKNRKFYEKDRGLIGVWVKIGVFMEK